MSGSNVVVMDNGAWELKVGIVNAETGMTSPKVSLPKLSVPNCVVKSAKGGVKQLLVADQTMNMREAATVYRRAFDRGYLVDWGLERKIWDRLFGGDGLSVRCDTTDLLCTVPPLQPRRLLDELAEIAFEEYRFTSLFAPSAASMVPWDPLLKSGGTPAKGCIILDVGYSHSHVVPCYDGYPMNHAMGRCDVAGKALTNYLKELISYRQWNMMDETWLVNYVKERLSYVSLDFEAEMRALERNPRCSEFVLPDYVTSRTGWIKGVDAPPPDPADGQPRPPEQILKMSSERFAVPECLLRPSDMGLPQMGITEGLLYSLHQAPEALRPVLSSSVILVGGCALIPGLLERVRSDLRASLPEDFPLHVECPTNPQYSAWRGSSHFVSEIHYTNFRVSRRDYQDYGAGLCASKFALY